MAKASESAIKSIGKVLNDSSRPMKERFRALFTLRNLGGETAIECISQCFVDESVLLKHELAYCLGQMQDQRAIPVLRSVLEDKNQDPIVRHEAGSFLSCNSQDVDKYCDSEYVSESMHGLLCESWVLVQVHLVTSAILRLSVRSCLLFMHR